MEAKESEKFINEFFEKQRQIMISKTNDYANDNDVLANFKSVAELTGLTPAQVINVMIATKIVRLNNLLSNNKQPNNESINDNLLDLANYTVRLAQVLSEKKETKKEAITPKIGDVLIAKNECIMDDTKEKTLIIGKAYEVMEVLEEVFFIFDEVGTEHWFELKDWNDYFYFKKQ